MLDPEIQSSLRDHQDLQGFCVWKAYQYALSDVYNSIQSFMPGDRPCMLQEKAGRFYSSYLRGKE